METVNARPLAALFRDAQHNSLKNRTRSFLRRRAERVNGSQSKRCFDIAASLAAIIALAPLFLIVAAIVKLESPGPVFFRQERYGLRKRRFMIFKFRTMTVTESTGDFTQAVKDDPRVTRVGRMLRNTSVDELPQLFNVLLGHMSIVGPRPHAVSMDDTFASMIKRYDERHLVKPGLTGLAQCQGFRGQTDSIEKIAERIRRDRVYIRSWSLAKDFAIMATTLGVLLGPNAF